MVLVRRCSGLGKVYYPNHSCLFDCKIYYLQESKRLTNLANVCQVVSDKNIKGQISKNGKLNKPTGCGFEENI